MNRDRERLYINVVKGIAIVLMMWGHCIQYSSQDSFDSFDHPVFQFIYSFHMPLFMLVSGYLFWFSFEKRDLKSLLIHRTQGMLQPIVFASMLNIFLMKFPTFLIHGEISLANGALLNGLYSLWFLWCVLSSGIAVALAEKLGKNTLIRLIGLVLGFYFVALFPENDYHMYMYPYFVAGFLYGKNRSRIPSRISGLAKLSLVIFPLMLPLFEKWHFIYLTPILFPYEVLWQPLLLNGFRWMIGFAGSLVVLTVTDMLFRWTVDETRVPRVFTMLAKLGENSLSIYCLSVSLLSYYFPKAYARVMLVTGRNILTENTFAYNVIYMPLLTVAYCVGLYYAVLFMKKIKIHKLIFGR